MISLRDLQSEFKQYLFDHDDKISSHVVGTTRVASDVRLWLYSNAYYSRLVEALENDFQALSVLLGEDAFVSLCHEYTRANPSTYFTLRFFGQHFCQFLRSHFDYKTKQYLIELAEFEWSFINAFDAADTDAINENDIASIPQEAWLALKMTLHPSVQLVKHTQNVRAIWCAVKDEKPLPKPERLAETDHYIIWRDVSTIKTQYRYLEQDEAVALDVVSKGGSFVAICEALTTVIEDQNEIPLRAASLLKTWVNTGLLTGLSWQ